MGFSCDCTRSAAHDTSPTQADIIPPATRWRAYTRPDTLNRYQILTPCRAAVHVSTAAYYNKVYKRVQHTADHASPAGSAPTVCGSLASAAPGAPAEWVNTSTCTWSARRLAIWHWAAVRAHRVSLAPSTRRGSPAAGARWAARNHWRLSPHLFSGFRPIANKGEQ